MKNAVINSLYESFSYSAKSTDTKVVDKEIENLLDKHDILETVEYGAIQDLSKKSALRIKDILMKSGYTCDIFQHDGLYDIINIKYSRVEESLNESPEAKDIAPDVLDYREKMQNAMKTRFREWGVNSIAHFGHAVANTYNELLELEQDGLFSKEAFNKTYALKCISSIINYVENDVLNKLYEYKSYIENK